MSGFAKFVKEAMPWIAFNGIVSVVVIAIIIERLVYFLGKGAVNAKAFLEQIRKLVAANNIDRAIKLCSATEAPVARVAKSGLSRVHRGEAAVSAAMEETLVDAAPEIKKRVNVLWSLANIATLIGLLGTVSGLIKAFGAIQGAKPEERQGILASSISEAMGNTAVGLGIAVICMIAHVFLGAMSKKQVTELEGFAMKLENILAEGTPQAAPGAQAAGR
jgi:biopolymer transport protein ExbB